MFDNVLLTVAVSGVCFSICYDELYRVYWVPQSAALFDSFTEACMWCKEMAQYLS